MAARSAIKKVMKDLKEMESNPHEGAALGLTEDLFQLHGNLVIPYGPYAGLMVHIVLKLKDTFPASSPAGSVAPSYPFDGTHHGHIHGGKMCNDMLSDYEFYFRSMGGSSSGWSSEVSLSGLMMMLRLFLANTDNATPSKEKVEAVFAKVAKYECPGCDHKGWKPFPALPVVAKKEGKPERKEGGKGKEKSETEESRGKRQRREKRGRELLLCGGVRDNYIDNRRMTLGYPLAGNSKSLELLPELVSYDHYILQCQQGGLYSTEKNLQRDQLKTPVGESSYSHWLPAYINEEHFLSGRAATENSLMDLSNLLTGKDEKEFTPSTALQVLPKLIGRLAERGVAGPSGQNVIFAYCHSLRLLARFLESGEGGLWKTLDAAIESFLKDPRGSKLEIGEVMVLLGMSKNYSFFDEGVQKCVMEEHFVQNVQTVETFAKTQKLRTKTEEQVQKEEEEEDQQLARKAERELSRLGARILKERQRSDAEEASSVHSLTIRNFAKWKKEKDFPPLQSSSSSSSPKLVMVNTTARKEGLKWDIKLRTKDEKIGLQLRLVEGWERWGSDWKLQGGVSASFGGELHDKTSRVFLTGKKKFLEIWFDSSKLVQFVSANGDLNVEADVSITKVSSSSHRGRCEREQEEAHKRKVASLNREKKRREEKRKRQREEREKQKVLPLPAQLALHYKGSAKENGALVFGAFAPGWFLVEEAREVLDSSFGLPPQSVVNGVLGLKRMSAGLREYHDFLRVLKFDDQVEEGTAGVLRLIRGAELVLEDKAGLDPFLFLWRHTDI